MAGTRPIVMVGDDSVAMIVSRPPLTISRTTPESPTAGRLTPRSQPLEADHSAHDEGAAAHRLPPLRKSGRKPGQDDGDDLGQLLDGIDDSAESSAPPPARAPAPPRASTSGPVPLGGPPRTGQGLYR
jgi:hypothetical protein